MARYKVEGLRKTFGHGEGAFTAINGVDIDIEPGEMLVLLGPSGCGKTTTLRCLAGLETADEGRLSFGDHVVFDSKTRVNVPPERRNVGMVFQSYALWPHKTVRQNIAYPLQVRGMKKALKEEDWVGKAAELVDCSALLGRYPGQLSGGQQQRVALARGIVSRPDLVLFDEPLSNLDALLRTRVRSDLHELHQSLQFTSVYVTHDQAEAFALGDRLAVMRAGNIDQIGTAAEVYERPATDYTANFVGMTNYVDFSRSADGWRVDADPEITHSDLPLAHDADVARLRFRSADVRVVSDGDPVAGVRVRALVRDRVYTGHGFEITVSVGDNRLAVIVPSETALSISKGDRVTLEVPAARSRWYEPDGGSIGVEPRERVSAGGPSAR